MAKSADDAGREAGLRNAAAKKVNPIYGLMEARLKSPDSPAVTRSDIKKYLQSNNTKTLSQLTKELRANPNKNR